MARRKRRQPAQQNPQTPPQESPLSEVVLSRSRPPALRLKEEEKRSIVQRVIRFAADDRSARQKEIEERVHLHAKIHQVTGQSSGRWSGSSDAALPDIAAACFREEDTLLNAAMSVMPIVEAKAANPRDKGQERRLSMLIHHQMMIEQNGPRTIEQLACDFTRDGVYTLLTTWVREKRETVQVRQFEAIPADKLPKDYFRRILRENMGARNERSTDKSGWEWRFQDGDGQWFDVAFYTTDEGEVEAEIRGEVIKFNAPKFIRYAYENVLHPYYCDNLQPPCPSNPNGASHVILVDQPTVGEVKQLIRTGEYNRVTVGDIKEDAGKSHPDHNRSLYELSIESEVDMMRGFDQYIGRTYEGAKNHGLLTRYTCYDVWERGDGREVDVIFVVLPELKLLVRAVPLGEECPIVPPMRPLSEASRIPVTGRRIGFSLPKTMNGTHDVKKDWVDLMIDSSELEAVPMFAYQERSSIDALDYSVYPGAGWPERNQGDLRLMQFSPQSGAVALNIISLMDSMQEDVSMLGDLQAGRIPAGKSAALRNSGTVEKLLLQGEARPQRLLARFFSGIAHAAMIAHGLNVHYLSPNKAFRVMGAPDRDEELIELQDGDLSADIRFSFVASIFNASKVAQQQGLDTFFQIAANPLMLELGIVTGDHIFRLLSDIGRALGVDAERYSQAPSPEGDVPPVSAQTAFNAILGNQAPSGRPQETPPQRHFQLLNQYFQTFAQSAGVPLDRALSKVQMSLLLRWLEQVQQFIQQQEAKQRQVQAAQQLQSARQQGAQAGAVESLVGQAGPVQRNDVTNESLPSSGTPQ